MCWCVGAVVCVCVCVCEYEGVDLQHLGQSWYGRDSSAGKASDRRSEGRRFDPGSGHAFMYLTWCLGLWFRTCAGACVSAIAWFRPGFVHMVCRLWVRSSCRNAGMAAIAQLGERQTEDLKVPGSIPGLGTQSIVYLISGLWVSPFAFCVLRRYGACVMLTRPGLEPGISGSGGRRLLH